MSTSGCTRDASLADPSLPHDAAPPGHARSCSLHPGHVSSLAARHHPLPWASLQVSLCSAPTELCSIVTAPCFKARKLPCETSLLLMGRQAVMRCLLLRGSFPPRHMPASSPCSWHSVLALLALPADAPFSAAPLRAAEATLAAPRRRPPCRSAPGAAGAAPPGRRQRPRARCPPPAPRTPRPFRSAPWAGPGRADARAARLTRHCPAAAEATLAAPRCHPPCRSAPGAAGAAPPGRRPRPRARCPPPAP